ncbi:MAG TPA: hypothetical protein VIJ85_14210 [Rhizomicrobium sp.]
MRTTLTLEKDVAIALEKLQQKRASSFKEVVNEALRQGIRMMNAPGKPRKPFRTLPLDLGKPLFNSPEELKALIAQIDEDEDLQKLGLK